VTLSCKDLDSSTISQMRLIRYLRMFRIIRLLDISKDGKAMVHSIEKSIHRLLWPIMLMITVIYALSVLISLLALDAKVKLQEPSVQEAIEYWFGNIPRTCLTLLEAIIGGVSWDEPAMVLFNHVDSGSGLLFVVYTAFGTFVLLNVVLGVFVDAAMRLFQEEADLNVIAGISEVFLAHEEDEPTSRYDSGDLNQDITWEVFNEKLDTPQVQKYFKLINVDISEARGLFELIDVDSSGNIDAREIVEGCLRLKGSAKALDLSLLIGMQNAVNDQIHDHIEKIDDHICKVDDHIGNFDGHIQKVADHIDKLQIEQRALRVSVENVQSGVP